MKNPFERRTAGSLAASIAIHILVIAALVQIAFRYPLGQLMGLAEKDETPERIQFVKVPPASSTIGASAAQSQTFITGSSMISARPVATSI